MNVPEEPVLGPDGLTVEEVGALWAFLHGDIMIGGIRQRVREHWGLCPRHAWGHAVVEIELWETGAGARGGHQPFDVIVLQDDLLETARHTLTSSRRSPKHSLRRRGSCYVCDQLTGATDRGLTPIGYAGFNSEPLTEETNRLEYSRKWMDETSPVWSARTCPRCSDDQSPRGVLCRPHLVADDAPHEAVDQVIPYLDELAPRLKRLLDSMSEHGKPATPDDDAAWIEVLGWLHGWTFPLQLAAA